MVRVEVIPNRSILDIGNYDQISYTDSHGDLFREFCIKNNIPISLPYIGGQYWAEPIAKLGHIAIFSDAFSICAYAFYKLDRQQRLQVIGKKEEWNRNKFSGVIVNEQGIIHKFDSVLLETSNDKVIDRFTYELTYAFNPLTERRLG
ncbi:MAG: hypothetical protein K2I72_00890 [Bacilli bacterium]|nr:hypothetical protein [Bacilli bacterium]